MTIYVYIEYMIIITFFFYFISIYHFFFFKQKKKLTLRSLCLDELEDNWSWDEYRWLPFVPLVVVWEIWLYPPIEYLLGLLGNCWLVVRGGGGADCLTVPKSHPSSSSISHLNKIVMIIYI